MSLQGRPTKADWQVCADAMEKWLRAWRAYNDPDLDGGGSPRESCENAMERAEGIILATIEREREARRLPAPPGAAPTGETSGTEIGSPEDLEGWADWVERVRWTETADLYAECSRAMRSAARALRAAPPAREAGATEALLDVLEEEGWDLRAKNVPMADTGDQDVWWTIIEHHMAAPHEREVGPGGRTPAEAIRAATGSTPEAGEGER
jgi:hypothetical protein